MKYFEEKIDVLKPVDHEGRWQLSQVKSDNHPRTVQRLYSHHISMPKWLASGARILGR